MKPTHLKNSLSRYIWDKFQFYFLDVNSCKSHVSICFIKFWDYYYMLSCFFIILFPEIHWLIIDYLVWNPLNCSHDLNCWICKCYVWLEIFFWEPHLQLVHPHSLHWASLVHWLQAQACRYGDERKRWERRVWLLPRNSSGSTPTRSDLTDS